MPATVKDIYMRQVRYGRNLFGYMVHLARAIWKKYVFDVLKLKTLIPDSTLPQHVVEL